MERLPTKIDPCPLKEATFEIRFNTTFPPDTIYGIVYSKLKDDYPESKSLPIMQIPETVRLSDVNLANQPYYQMKNGNFLLQFGPRIMALSVVDVYCGWESFRQELLRVFNTISTLGFVSEITRIGLRYINTFETDILENISLRISINDSSINNRETFVRTVFENDSFIKILQIANNAIMTRLDDTQFKGSLIDIDVVKTGDNIPFFESMESFLDEAHQAEKKQFFELLNENFLQSLNPNYNGE